MRERVRGSCWESSSLAGDALPVLRLPLALFARTIDRQHCGAFAEELADVRDSRARRSGVTPRHGLVRPPQRMGNAGEPPPSAPRSASGKYQWLNERPNLSRVFSASCPLEVVCGECFSVHGAKTCVVEGFIWILKVPRECCRPELNLSVLLRFCTLLLLKRSHQGVRQLAPCLLTGPERTFRPLD